MRAVFRALARHATERPETLAFRDDGGAISWSGLAGRVAGLAHLVAEGPDTVAIGVPGGIDYVVADLALTLAGKRQVPLPFFFSAEQTAHILKDTGAGAVVSASPEAFAGLPLPVFTPDAAARALPDYNGGAQRVIYTSGSSGRPKGVVIGDRQLDASLAALSRVVGAGPGDVHLSVLPLPQLLEQICGIFLPILAGAQCVMRFDATRALLGGPLEGFTRALDEVAPTTSLIAPGLLGRWVKDLAAAGAQAPAGLRFVAVGGAASSPDLVRSAEAVGIPVHEGYGLSECCAVVAMNRPGENRPGTVGPILDGLEVKIIDGEITVSGPTVMEGYLHGAPVPERWHTGDLGRFEEGRLVVEGRKDALLVTPAGRNLSPEWIEARVNADPRVVGSALGLRARDGALVLIAVLAAPATGTEIAALLADLPDYARPAEWIATDPSEPDLLFPAGTPVRSTVARLVNDRPARTLPKHVQKERLAS